MMKLIDLVRKFDIGLIELPLMQRDYVWKPAKVIDLLDSLAPWGKQHVFLFHGPHHDIQAWKDPDHVHALLKRHRTGRLFNARLPLILPDRLTLSSLMHTDSRLRITAVQKRDYRERAPEHDEQKEIDGERIFLDAYTGHLTRTLVAFEWDLNANVAMLQITQLQKDGDYENLAKEFSQLVHSWLQINQFGSVDLRPVIAKLHATALDDHTEVRPSGVDYRTLQGRRVLARSASPKTSVFGEIAVDNLLDEVRKNAVGHLGNFYWLPKVNRGLISNPLTDEVHVIIVGARSRVNFPTPNTEDVVRYVLQRVRALGSTAS